MLAHCLLAFSLVLLGTVVAVLGSHFTTPAITVAGVALIVVGVRLLRPMAPKLIRWLESKGA